MKSDPINYPTEDLEAMSQAKNYYDWLYSEIEPYLGGRVAEIGAGTGNFSSRLLQCERVSALDAYEPAENLFPLLQNALEGDARTRAICGFFDGTMHRDIYDSIVYMNVLEHIEDDAEELRASREALTDGGRLIIFAPALQALYTEHDREVGHYRRYEKKQLESLVQDAGFHIEKLRYFDSLGALAWWVMFRLLRRPIRRGNVAFYDRFVVPILRRIETMCPPRFGKNILLVATK